MATQSFRRILELLEGNGVEYVVVGGVAAVLQGAPMSTFDIDALVKIDPRNIERLHRALVGLDARYREHANLRPTLADLAAGGHLLLITDSGPFDVLGSISGGKRYEDVEGSFRKVSLGELSFRVLSLEALIEDKKTLGRDKDRAVIGLLEAVVKRQHGG